MSKFANRRSPSGPQSVLQLPYYNTTPLNGLATFATIGASGSSPTEPGTQYRIPARGRIGILNPVVGRLDALQISNQPVNADAVAVTYQVQKNGVPVGPALVIFNNAVGPKSVDLSAISVLEGDLISIHVNTTLAALPTLPGSVAQILLTWVPGGAV